MQPERDSSGGTAMLKAAQRVVVIQDASRDICSSAINWALDGLLLKPGDELTLLGVLHQVNNTSTFPLIGGGKRNKVGFKMKVDSTSMLGASQKIINEELMRKENEYENNTEILQLSKLYDVRKVMFHKRLLPASLPKVAAVEAVKELQATWIILDRQMKKEKKYFLENLSCGILRMKRNNNIELLRGPKAEQQCGMLPGPERGAEIQEITEDTPEDDDLFSLDFSYVGETLGSKNLHERSRIETIINGRESLHVSGEQQQRSSKNRFSRKTPEGNLTVIQNGKAGSCMPYIVFDGQVIEWPKTVENIELGQNDSFIEAAMTSSSAMAELQEPVENSVCSYCQTGKASSGWKDFRYSELQAATKDFSTDNFLSEGGFGSVYKGMLESGQWVAVKQHKHASLQGEKEFISEVHVLSKVRHKNVVTLLGACSEGSQLLLVYEFICNGSLDKHLSECSPKVLSWRERIKIALGAASGLNYLHHNNIIHRDMRPNNILVTHTYEALIGDFGLAKTKHAVPDHSENNILGTFGYLAPEYAESGNATTKTDVYSFGVVLLELITGQNVNKTLRGSGLVEWALPLLGERRYPELIDEKIQDSYDVLQLFWMVSVAERCLSKNPDKRPPMTEVVNALQCIMENRTVTSSTGSTKSLMGQETIEDSSNNQTTQMSEAFLTASPAEPSSRRLPSPSMGTDGTSLLSETNWKKRRPKPRIRDPVSYDEMLS